jgi:hypothetical protein
MFRIAFSTAAGLAAEKSFSGMNTPDGQPELQTGPVVLAETA